MGYLLIVVAIFALDFSIKQYVELHFPEGMRKEIGNGKVILKKVYNRGAALNILEKKQEFVAGISTGLTVVTLLAELALLTRKGVGTLKLGLSLVLGGALSNIYDRLVRKYVIDYFSFGVKWKKIANIVFNLSDLFIFIGSFLIMIAQLSKKKK